MIISRCRGDKPKRKELAIVNPTPKHGIGNFCPLFILSAYLAARTKMAEATDSDFLFPNLQSLFESGTNRHILTITTPIKIVKYDSYRKKLAKHLDSRELKSIGVYS